MQGILQRVAYKARLRALSLLSNSTDEPAYSVCEEQLNSHVSSQKLRSFKNKHLGERCFIIGNGPSLNKIDLNKFSNDVTFGSNAIFLKTEEMGFKPTYYMVEDLMSWGRLSL